MYIFFFLFQIFKNVTSIEPEILKKLKWNEGVGTQDGASREYLNLAAGIKWTNYLGDWYDSKNQFMGLDSYNSTILIDDNTQEWIEWGVTTLVSEWLDGSVENNGFFLKGVAGSAQAFHFLSKESSDSEFHPKLILKGKDGSSFTLNPEADTFLSTSTYTSQGTNGRLTINLDQPILIRFDFSSVSFPSNFILEEAILKLFVDAEYGTQLTVAVFRVALYPYVEENSQYGIAKQFINDTDITNHTSVHFFTSFSSPNWENEWTSGVSSNLNTVEANDITEATQNKFVSFQGKGLKMNMQSNTNTGLSLSWNFATELGYEPEEIYMRYYVRHSGSWKTCTQDGGKMPGISGTYGRAGWGGRPSDGSADSGWSSRGSYSKAIPIDDTLNPLFGYVGIGNYVYHAEMVNEGLQYGNVWKWDRNLNGYLKMDKWYCVESYVKLNTPTQKDGVIKGWVNGRLAFEKQGLNFRNVDSLKIEKIWMNVYHGGKTPTVGDCISYFDNIVISDEYIGPIWPPISDEVTPTEPKEEIGLAIESIIAISIISPILILIFLTIFITNVLLILGCVVKKKQKE